MNGRVVVLGGWRAYVLAALVLALLLVLTVVAGIVVLALAAVGAVAFVAYRALRALGLARPPPRSGRDSDVIEGEYRVVERRLDDPAR